MRLRTAVALVCFVFALVGSIFGTCVTYSVADRILTEGVYNHLEMVVQSRAGHVETFLEGRKGTAEQLSASVVIEDFLSIDENDSEYDNKLGLVHKRLGKTVDLVDSILSTGVLDENGVLVASTTPSLIGTDYSELGYFQEAKREIAFGIVESPGKARFFGVGAPVVDSETGEFLGVVGINVNLEYLDKITTERTGLGETGEVYIINDEKLLMTSSRFLEDGVFIQKVETENADLCYEEHIKRDAKEHIGHEIIMPFLDYRGEKVLGAHQYISEVQWCLLAEIDEAEALGEPRREFIGSALFISVIVIFFIVLAGFFVGGWFEKIYLRKKKIVKEPCRFVKLLSKVKLGYFFVLGLGFAVGYFFVVAFFFRGWQNVKFFDAVPDLMIFVVAFMIFGCGFRFLNSFFIWGGLLVAVGKLVEFPLQEYVVSLGVLEPTFFLLMCWILVYAMNFVGILLILYAFREVVK